MRTLILSVFTIIGASLLLNSCSTLTVYSDKDKSVDFSQYKTFGFLPWDDASSKVVNDLNKRRLEDAVTAELVKRGMKRATDGYGDIAFAFHFTVEEKTGYTSYTTTYGGMGYTYGFGYGYYGYHHPGPTMTSTTTQPYTYKEGNLIIDGFDVKEKKLVWEVVASDDVREDVSNRDERIRQLISEMFKYYPVPVPENN